MRFGFAQFVFGAGTAGRLQSHRAGVTSRTGIKTWVDHPDVNFFTDEGTGQCGVVVTVHDVEEAMASDLELGCLPVHFAFGILVGVSEMYDVAGLNDKSFRDGRGR